MCDPVTFAAFAIQAAGSVVSYMGEQATYDANMERYEANVENARTATLAQYGSTQLRIAQEGAAATQKKFETGLEARRAAAAATVAAGEGGVSGLSVDALLGDIYAQKGRYTDSVNTNLDNTRAYLTNEMKSQEAQGQSQINSLPIPEEPSYVPYLIDIFGSGLTSYSKSTT